jgi:hypothetical protein
LIPSHLFREVRELCRFESQIARMLALRREERSPGLRMKRVDPVNGV